MKVKAAYNCCLQKTFHSQLDLVEDRARREDKKMKALEKKWEEEDRQRQACEQPSDAMTKKEWQEKQRLAVVRRTERKERVPELQRQQNIKEEQRHTRTGKGWRNKTQCHKGEG